METEYFSSKTINAAEVAVFVLIVRTQKII
jgi:hypothetical protein